MEEHTFVIPVYKESPYLEACIQSLIRQTVKSKVILVTSTPTTFSQHLAEVYNLPYIINHTTDTGAIANWNFALSVAQAPLVTIAHQDDIYEKNYVETITKTINNYKKNNLLIAFTNYTDMVDGIARRYSLNAAIKKMLLWPFFLSRNIESGFFKKLILKFGNPICCPSVTFNKTMVGDFKFKNKFKWVFDWYAWYELATLKGRFLYIDEKLVVRRLHGESGTSQQINNGEKLKDEQQMFELMWGKRFARIIARVYQLSSKDNLL